MQQLTDDGRMAVEGVAQRNGVSFDAAVTLLAALQRGNGFQAQFSHPDLGGMGQWSQGGMIMVGDMFNNGLKYRVDQLCNELSSLMRSRELFVPAPVFGPGGGSSGWWPAEFGQPASTGSQNDMHYALFPATRRLAIRWGDQVRLYDTGQHQIGGFSQQQGSDAQNLTFTSQFGTVRLYDLGLIGGNAAVSQPLPNQPSFAVQGQSPLFEQGPAAAAFAPPHYEPIQAPVHEDAPMPNMAPFASQPSGYLPAASSGPGTGSKDDIFASIERLHGLMTKGILSEQEFAQKKKDLLDRL